MTGFRPFFNPATGEWIEYTAQAEDGNGDYIRFIWRSVPGGVITEHVHPHQEERFTIKEGEAHFTLNGRAMVARAGETIIVPPGAPHSEGNSGPVDIEGMVELRPALRTKEFHEALAGLVNDGRTTPRGAPKNPLQLRGHLLALSPRKPGNVAAHLGRRICFYRPWLFWRDSSASSPTTSDGIAALTWGSSGVSYRMHGAAPFRRQVTTRLPRIDRAPSQLDMRQAQSLSAP